MTCPSVSVGCPSLTSIRGGEGRGERRPWRAATITALLALPAIAVFLSPTLATALQFDRTAVTSGQLWRMVTCHWTHWSLDHLAWDVAVFASLTCACACRRPRRLAPALALSVFAIPAAVFVFQPELATYRGLSGIDSALLMLLLIDAMKQKRGASVICAALLAAFIAKLLYEQVTGTATFVDAGRAGFVPVPLAHLVGAVAGAAAAAFKPRRFP